MVDHRAAVAQDGDALVDQALGHVAADRQALESAPGARLEKGVAQRHRAGLFERQWRSGPGVGGVGRQREVEPLPVVAGHVQPLFGVDARPVRGFQGHARDRSGCSARAQRTPS